MANVSAEASPESRYTRVKAILEAAAGGGASDYGGLGRFWDLPLDALVSEGLWHAPDRAGRSGVLLRRRGKPQRGSGLIQRCEARLPLTATVFRRSCGAEAGWRRLTSPSSPIGSTMAARLTNAAAPHSTLPSAK